MDRRRRGGGAREDGPCGKSGSAAAHRADLPRRRVRRDLRRLQPRRRSARPGHARRRLRRLPLARLQVPLRRPARASPASRRTRARHAVKVEGGRVLVSAEPVTKRTQAAARAAPARAQAEREPGPPRVLGISTTVMTRRTRATARRSACSKSRSTHARASARLRDAAASRLRDALVPALRGLLLEGRPRVHLAVLDHRRWTRRTSSNRSTRTSCTGPTCPRRDADPLGRRSSPLLQDGRAHELHPEPDHDSRTAS